MQTASPALQGRAGQVAIAYAFTMLYTTSAFSPLRRYLRSASRALQDFKFSSDCGRVNLDLPAAVESGQRASKRMSLEVKIEKRKTTTSLYL